MVYRILLYSVYVSRGSEAQSWKQRLPFPCDFLFRPDALAELGLFSPEKPMKCRRVLCERLLYFDEPQVPIPTYLTSYFVTEVRPSGGCFPYLQITVTLLLSRRQVVTTRHPVCAPCWIFRLSRQ